MTLSCPRHSPFPHRHRASADEISLYSQIHLIRISLLPSPPQELEVVKEALVLCADGLSLLEAGDRSGAWKIKKSMRRTRSFSRDGRKVTLADPIVNIAQRIEGLFYVAKKVESVLRLLGPEAELYVLVDDGPASWSISRLDSFIAERSS